jgi:hypothetical protein
MSDEPERPLPEGTARFATALAGMTYNTTEALEKAIWAWADFADIPHKEATRNRIACAMFAALAIYLETEEPEAIGWLGLTNRQFAEKLKEKMLPPDPDGPVVHAGTALMHVYADMGQSMVVLKYTEDMAIVLPPDTARTMAEGLLACAGEIDGRTGTLFYFGVPPTKRPEEEAGPEGGG